MKYPYPAHRINEIVKAPKEVREGETFETVRKGDRGLSFDVNIELEKEDFIDLRYLGSTCDPVRVESYEANFVLSARRIRGVGFQAVSRRRFYKERISAGWHQNVINPNLPTDHVDYNRHEILAGFSPMDFQDFIQKTANLWNIKLALEGAML